MESSGKMLWLNCEFLIKCKWKLIIWDTLENCGLKVDVNITLFSKDFSTFWCTAWLRIEDNLPNSDFTNIAECPLAAKWAMYSDDFILKSAIVEQILCKQRATPLNKPFLEDYLWQDDASGYKWL